MLFLGVRKITIIGCSRARRLGQFSIQEVLSKFVLQEEFQLQSDTIQSSRTNSQQSSTYSLLV